MKKIIEAIAWGGADDTETFLDVLVKIQEIAPAARFRILEANPVGTGGWPLVEIEYDETDDEVALFEFTGRDLDEN